MPNEEEHPLLTHRVEVSSIRSTNATRYTPIPSALSGRQLAYERSRPTIYGNVILALCSLIVLYPAFTLFSSSDTPTPRANIRTPENVGQAVLSSMDLNVDPCSDFYRYACGSWLRKQHIPEDATSYSRSFTSVSDSNRFKLREILENDLQDESHPNAIAGRFYAACMHGYAKGPLDTAVLKPFVSLFQGLKDADSFAVLLAKLHSSSTAALFELYVGVDEKHPERYSVSLAQDGLGLSHPNDYTVVKPNLVKLRAAYLILIERILQTAADAGLIDGTDVAELAGNTFEFEKNLASIQKLPEELRDPSKLYNPLTYAQFPHDLFIDKYMTTTGVDESKINSTIIVEDPVYMGKIAEIMSHVKSDLAYRNTFKAYLAFHLVRRFASLGMMGEELYNETFDFRTVQTGVKKIAPRWKRCQSLASNYVGDQLGEAFVKKHFPPKTKAAADKLVAGIIDSFERVLETEDWMDKSTKRKAIQKLANLGRKIGYTSKFDTYPSLVISKLTFSSNLLNAMQYASKLELSRLGGPIDETEWFMKSYEVNAYFAPPRNEIVFPAGILQQPFFSDAFPDAMKYGSMGVVIGLYLFPPIRSTPLTKQHSVSKGHESSHSLDNSGRKYDKDGRLSPWWAPETASKYEKRVSCFVDLFNGFTPRGIDVHLNGNLTLGENLADTGGVKVSFQAFKRAGNADPTALAPNPILAKKLTNHQLFFVAYAQTYCNKRRRKALREQVLTDPHSPGEFRVRGPLSQTPEFSSAFKCKVGANYNPKKKCKLW